MDIGFYHPEVGYWQAVGVSKTPYDVIVEPERTEAGEDGEDVVIPAVTRETSQFDELMAGYPEGTVEVPLRPGPDHEWQAGVWVAPSSPTPEELRETFPDLNPAQIRLGLFSIGVTEAMVEAKLPDEEARIEWRTRPSYKRLHPLVLQLSSPEGFDLPADQVDALWLWAAGL